MGGYCTFGITQFTQIYRKICILLLTLSPSYCRRFFADIKINQNFNQGKLRILLSIF